MRIIVASRDESAVLSSYIQKPHVWITIHDPYSGAESLSPNPLRLAVLDLAFHDIACHYGGYAPMSQEQAREIVSFVKRWKDKVSVVVSQCDAGISRSAAVAAALDLWLNGVDSISSNPIYFPNVQVKATLLRELGLVPFGGVEAGAAK